MAEIRKASYEDVQHIVRLGELMAGESPRFSRYPYRAERARDTVEHLMAVPMGIVLVALHDGDVVGFFMGAAFPHFACDYLTATDLALYVHPAFRGGTSAARMVREYVRWAESIGAEPNIGVNTGVHPGRTGDLLAALGAKQSGTTWTWGI